MKYSYVGYAHSSGGESSGLTAEFRLQSQGYPCVICEEMTLGQAFLRVRWFFPGSYYSTNAPFFYVASGTSTMGPREA
jgi:hypothetical protein